MGLEKRKQSEPSLNTKKIYELHSSMMNIKENCSYIPNLAMDHILKICQIAPHDGIIHLNPCEIHTEGIVMMADISGFTSLAEMLQRREGVSSGVDILQGTINKYFEIMVMAVDQCGGDVIKFAGDSIICYWDVSDKNKVLENSLRAVEGALLMLSNVLKKNEDIRPPSNEVERRQSIMNIQNSTKLTLHIGLGMGNTVKLCVGGFRGQYEYLIAGESLTDASNALKDAERNEVVISDGIWKLAPQIFGGIVKGTDKYHLINKLSVAIELVESHREELITLLFNDLNLYKRLEPSFESFLPKPVLKILKNADLGSNGIDSLTQIRRVTTIFIQLGDPDFNTKQFKSGVMSPSNHSKSQANIHKIGDKNFNESLNGNMKSVGSYITDEGEMKRINTWGVLVNINKGGTKKGSEIEAIIRSETVPESEESNGPSLQKTFYTLQMIIASKGGMVRQLLVDDKGLVVIVAFGVTQHSFSDNCNRAINLAQEGRSTLKKDGFDLAIGISTGEVFTGTVGSETRREYAMVGNKVNLAARLMSLAAKTTLELPSIICDIETYKESKSTYKFKEHDPVNLKGIKEPVKIFSPIVKIMSVLVENPDIERLLKGRDDVRGAVSIFFRKLPKKGPSCLIISGENGAGKTVFLKNIEHIINFEFNRFERGMSVITYPADVEHQNIAYYFFGEFIRTILGLQSGMLNMFNETSQRNHFIYQLMRLRINEDIEKFINDLDKDLEANAMARQINSGGSHDKSNGGDKIGLRSNKIQPGTDENVLKSESELKTSQRQLLKSRNRASTKSMDDNEDTVQSPPTGVTGALFSNLFKSKVKATIAVSKQSSPRGVEPIVTPSNGNVQQLTLEPTQFIHGAKPKLRKVPSTSMVVTKEEYATVDFTAATEINNNNVRRLTASNSPAPSKRNLLGQPSRSPSPDTLFMRESRILSSRDAASQNDSGNGFLDKISPRSNSAIFGADRLQDLVDSDIMVNKKTIVRESKEPLSPSRKSFLPPTKTIHRKNSLTACVNDATYKSKLLRFLPFIEFVTKADLRSVLSGHEMSKLSISQRTKKVQDAIFLLIKSIEPCTLLIDDAQYLDEMSLSMIERILAQSELRVSIVIGKNDSIELPFGTQKFFKSIRGYSDGNKLKLHYKEIIMKPLNKIEVTQIVSSELNVPIGNIPVTLTDLLFKISGGNPRFLHECLQTMLKSGIIELNTSTSTCSLKNTFDDSRGSLTANSITTKKIELTDESSILKYLVVQRFDQLAEVEQAILKVASVMSVAFPVALLSTLVPLGTRENSKTLDNYLDYLVEQTYLEAHVADKVKFKTILADSSTSKKTLFYEFQSPYVRRCIRETIPNTLLQKYHRKIARYYELKYGDDMINVFPLVAAHYTESLDFDKAFKCYERASRSNFFIGNEETGLEMLMRGLSLVPHCTFEEYEGYKINQLVEWYLKARDYLLKFHRDQEAAEYYQEALKLVHNSAYLLQDRKLLATVDLNKILAKNQKSSECCLIS